MVYELSILPLPAHTNIPNFHDSIMERGGSSLWPLCLMIIPHTSYSRTAQGLSSLCFYFWNGNSPPPALLWEHDYLNFPQAPLHQVWLCDQVLAKRTQTGVSGDNFHKWHWMCVSFASLYPSPASCWPKEGHGDCRVQHHSWTTR